MTQKEGRWIRRVLETRQDGYANYGRYATFQPDESVYGSYYLHSTEPYAGAYRLGNPWYSTDETISNGFSHNAAENKTYYQLKLTINVSSIDTMFPLWYYSTAHHEPMIIE